MAGFLFAPVARLLHIFKRLKKLNKIFKFALRTGANDLSNAPQVAGLLFYDFFTFKN